MKTLQSTVFALLASLACLPHAAKADIVLNILESGSDVVAVFSGSIDLTSAISGGSNSTPDTSMTPSAMQFFSRSGNSDNVYGVSGIAGTAFGTGALTAGTSRTGDSFGFEPFGRYLVFYVPDGYVSSNPLSGSATWANATIASLGITPGTYSIIGVGNTVTLNAGVSLPEPSTYAMALAGLACGGCSMFRRRKRA